jgi:hypothetical protein
MEFCGSIDPLADLARAYEQFHTYTGKTRVPLTAL